MIDDEALNYSVSRTQGRTDIRGKSHDIFEEVGRNPEDNVHEGGRPKQGNDELDTISHLPSAPTASPIKCLHRICYLGLSAAEPDKLVYCFDFAPGKASGMEELA